MMLKDKVILITGSTTGIGKATARRCVAEGAKVMIHGRDEARAKELCDELGAGNAKYVITDLDNQKAYALLIHSTIEAFGAFHGLVNNAAIYPRSNIDTSNAELFDEIMTINLKAPLLLSREAVMAFRQQKTPGSIVNIGSINAYCGQPDLLIYAMSKGGLMTMTRNLSDALGIEHIRINQLNVGWTPTETEIALKRSEGMSEDWTKRIPPIYAPTGQLQSPGNVAAHIAFWLSDDSAPTSGVVYEVEQYPIIGRNRISDLKIE